MDKQMITEAAQAAINSLQLDCRIKAVSKPLGKGRWCIEFSERYGKFCDEFQDDAGREDSPELIREKIKRHFFRMRKPARNRRRAARTAGKAGWPVQSPGGPLEAIEEVIEQTPRLVGKVVETVSQLAEAALKSEIDVSIDLDSAQVKPSTGPHAAAARKSKQPLSKLRTGSGKTKKAGPVRSGKPKSAARSETTGKAAGGKGSAVSSTGKSRPSARKRSTH